MSRKVENNEPDTINYQFYLNRCETKCMIHEHTQILRVYLAHITGVASKTILLKIFNIAKINRLDVYGNPSEELQKVLKVLIHKLSIYSLDLVVKSWIISSGLSGVNYFYRNKSTSLFHFI